MIIREITEKDREVFNKAATHPLQSYEWGEFRKRTGIKVIRRGVFEDNKLVNGIQVTIHKVPKTNWQIGYFPKGIMPDEGQLKALEAIAKDNQCLFIKCEPNVGSKIIEGKSQTKAYESIDSFLKQRGCKKGRPMFTQYSFQVDLTKSEDQLLSQMHSKTRYNIRLAEKKGVRVEKDNSDECFEEFLKILFKKTLPRQGFYAHTPDYYRQLWSILKPSGIANLHKAFIKNDTLAIFMSFKFNEVLYYPYGASTREKKELMAPNLLMWEMIKFGKAEGLKKFDMWGSLGPEASKKDEWYGFHKFKQGYGGDLIEFMGSYDLVIKPKFYIIYRILEILRWSFLKSKSKIKKIPGQAGETAEKSSSKITKFFNELIKSFADNGK